MKTSTLTSGRATSLFALVLALGAAGCAMGRLDEGSNDGAADEQLVPSVDDDAPARICEGADATEVGTPRTQRCATCGDGTCAAPETEANCDRDCEPSIEGGKGDTDGPLPKPVIEGSDGGGDAASNPSAESGSGGGTTTTPATESGSTSSGGAQPSVCGNDRCEIGESLGTCPKDCWSPSCGDATCAGFEQSWCDLDCAAPSTTATCVENDGVCDPACGTKQNLGDPDCDPGEGAACPGPLARQACIGPNTDAKDVAEGDWGHRDCFAGVWDNCSSPLVFVFDPSARVEFVTDATRAFPLSDVPVSLGTDWVSAKTPWLALDRDANGAIESGEELFGSMTKLASGKAAKNGFEALAELDSNHDGVIDASDARFAELRVWADADGDRASSKTELAPLASRGIVRIGLVYSSANPRCDARGNCEIERGSFAYVDSTGAEKTGAIVDVWFTGR